MFRVRLEVVFISCFSAQRLLRADWLMPRVWAGWSCQSKRSHFTSARDTDSVRQHKYLAAIER